MAIVEAVVTFAVVFGLLVLFHELGHFLAAKAFRMPVEEFAINFGPKLFTLFRSGGTEYNIRAIPMGGFVRIAGMELEPRADDDPAAVTGFNARPVFQRFVVILAGPIFSLLLGYLCYVVYFGLYGVPSGRPVFHDVMPGKPAMVAGMRPGDIVISIDGKSVSPLDMIDTIEGAVGRPLTFVVRGSDPGSPERTLTVTPVGEREGTTMVGRIGVATGEELRPTHGSEAFVEAAGATRNFFVMMKSIINSGKAKEAVGGPVGIARTFYQTAGTGVSTKLELMASLSLSLFLFNLFPIPILDGGHLMLLTLEAIRRRKLSVEAMQWVHVAGFAIIGVLFLAVMFNDITKWIGRH